MPPVFCVSAGSALPVFKHGDRPVFKIQAGEFPAADQVRRSGRPPRARVPGHGSGSRMKWFSFSLIFNLSEEHFYFSNDEEGRLSCKMPIEVSSQEKNEGFCSFLSRLKSTFLAKRLVNK